MMSPVRWKYILVTIAIALVQCVTVAVTDAQQMQDVISMTADGWRPIVGTRRHPPYKEEITHYRSPNVKENPKKAETPPSQTTTLTTTASPSKVPTKPIGINNGGTFKKYASKVPHNSKPNPSSQIFYGVSHGPHIPLNGVPPNRPIPVGPVKKFTPNNNKFPPHLQGNGKRGKPVRGQATAYSNRDEVYAPAPNSGTYSFIAQGPNVIKTRDPPGILLGSNHYTINQQGSHIDFNSRFPGQNDNVYQTFNTNPIQNFVFSKQKVNDVPFSFKNQNDEYTRNLVPPPQPYKSYQEKELIKNKIINNKEAVTQSSIQNAQFIKNGVPQNLGLQVPPPFEQNNFNYAQNEVKPNDHTVEVEVTKQKLKVFHNNIPSNYNPNNPDYVDYDYHTLKRPTELPKLATYEVTEGKQWQETPPFHYRFPGPQQITQRPKKPTVPRRPQISPPPSPQKEELPLIELSRPILELNLPPFLPTPYKPEGVVPTSPTQEDVSSIFSHLSTKVKTHSYQPNFFDVKEVSTHFPILGRPEIKPEFQTEFNPFRQPEFINEITTNNAELETEREQTTTLRPKDTQKTRGTHRRRRPSNRLRITTTEEPIQTAIYEVQKSPEAVTEISVETERPVRRRPNRYRTTTTESPIIEEQTTRVRNRQRQKPNDYSNESQRLTTIRKRVRPTEMPLNHKLTQQDVSSTEYKPTTEEQSNEQYSSSTAEGLESIYSKESDRTEETTNPKTNRYEYEITSGRYPTLIEDIEKYPITAGNNNLDSVKYLNKDTDVEPTEKTTEIIPTTNIHMPENEVDYQTPQQSFSPSVVTEHETDGITIGTTIPTTTTTEEVTTTRSHRVRGRPVKYDSSNRPRFSVKDYRQRLSTTSTTTESYKSTSSSRVRFPNRSRRPLTSTTTTTVSPSSDDGDDEVEQHTETMRTRFRPKEPRFSVTTESSDNIITEKSVKAVNTRLRPFGRQRSTTEATTVKVSIKPNLFSQRRRPPPLSLKNRILNKLNRTQETTTTDPEIDNDTETSDHSTVTYEVNTPDITTEIPSRTKHFELTTEDAETTTNDILKNDALLYSQRVSDLTSSFKNEYDTPGLFKNVSPTSRRIPNHFTIATDDPRLPIEAFFPNIKDTN